MSIDTRPTQTSDGPPSPATDVVHPALETPVVVDENARGSKIDRVVFGVTAAIALAFVAWGFLDTDSLGGAS
ncbi:MAG TPA: BCCT family transporter, partial [Nocardioides sp.]|nr:BCCT family transporter [Nocardioides sp.]